MNISILTLGTRGDVQPYVALGKGLQRAGHAVTLGTSTGFEAMVADQGLHFSSFQFNPREILADPDSRAAFVSTRAALRLYRKVAPMMPRLLDDAWAAAQGAQLILYHPKIINGLDIAEKLRVPCLIAFYVPGLSPTSAFPSPFFPGPARWGKLLNKWSHELFLLLMTAPHHRVVNRWRQEVLKLPPRPWSLGTRFRETRNAGVLYGYSPCLIPVPTDWNRSVHVTGHWFLDCHESWRPPIELAQFLASGAPPVCVGFGSIAGQDPPSATRMVVEALRRARLRGILVCGWGGLSAMASSQEIHFVDSVPYDWLFPRVAAVVHHGGAGSTAQGLRAGKPTVVCPFFGDQFFWGRTVHALGAGPRPIAQKKLNVQALSDAIQVAATDEGMARRASELGQKIRSEDGVGRAVGIIHSLFTAR